MTDAPLLEVENLKVHFPLRKSLLGGVTRKVHAVDGVSFSLPAGRTFGLVGESGSGKTTTAFALVRLVEPTDGTVKLLGEDITHRSGKNLLPLRRMVQMIFQDPYSSLNPRLRAGAIVEEPLELMGIGTREERRQRAEELFGLVGLRRDQLDLFPHQFSGGQRQRIGIARALAGNPKLIVCDEPVSALDVAIQAQILNLLTELQQELGLAYLFISHDLGVVQYLCDEIAVMYLGRIVEQAPRAALFANPLHPYTWALFEAVPRLERRRQPGRRRSRLEGDPPSPIDLPKGCRFAGRCRFAEARCHDQEPQLRATGDGHLVACHIVGDDGRVPHRPATL
ncbi:MAG: ATP-binding cassette domain-containing protein [Hyphomicrobiaceae bacterium]